MKKIDPRVLLLTLPIFYFLLWIEDRPKVTFTPTDSALSLDLQATMDDHAAALASVLALQATVETGDQDRSFATPIEPTAPVQEAISQF